MTQLLHRALQTPHNARVLFVDMNGFFASIEQQDRPELRDKPIAVVSHMHPRATVLASSYEAKAFGISTGTKLTEAKELCPDVIFLEPTPGRYKQVHNQIIRILEDICGPEVQPRSIDEAAVFLAPNWWHRAREVALEIKDRFREELGPHIRCSIGIAPNSLLAKLATELQKPDGLVEITLENTPDILSKIELTTLPGIATRMEAQLFRKGITTPLELYNTDADTLRAHFGIWGQYWWWRLHGYECDGMSLSTLKSMSHEHVLSPWIWNRLELESVVAKMADRLLYRLERNQLQCRHIYLTLKLAGAPRFTRDRILDASTANVPFLLESFQKLLADVPERLPFAVRKITLGTFGLGAQEYGDQLNLFSSNDKGLPVGETLYAIREKYGYKAIQVASTLRLEQAVAKEQLGFGRLRDIKNLSEGG